MSKLSRIFKRLTPSGRKRDDDVHRLCDWLDGVRDDVEKKFAPPNNPGALNQSLGFSIDVDGSRLTQEELAPVASKIEALHDLCRSLDIRLDIAGFDPLPRTYTVVADHIASSGRGVAVSADSGQTYGQFSHPKCTFGTSLKNGFPKPRPAAVQTQAAPANPAPAGPDVQREMEGGLAEGITVKGPLRLKPHD